MERKLLKVYFLLFGAALLFQQCTTEKIGKPNVVILLADDMGYGDLHCYGGPAITPNIDQLAEQGVRFTNCYAGAPNCSPSRVSLLTGRMPSRSGMYSYKPVGSVMHLPDSEITIAEWLKTSGYQTAHFGKWHLGCLPQNPALSQPQPAQQGFDYSFGTEGNAQPSHLNPVNFVRNGEKVGKLEGYSCQLLASDVDRWLNQDYKKDAPFFMYVAFHEPHEKIASPPDLIEHYPDCDKPMAEYYANIENLDYAVGKILKTLEAKGLRKNTLVFFASDNGPINYGCQGNLRGFKGEVYEGGIKVPGILSYSGLNEKAKQVNTPIWFPDLFPSICDIVDLEVPNDRQMDGTSILPLVDGKTINRQQAMFWFFYRSKPEAAMRFGEYIMLAGANDTVKRTHWISDRDMDFIRNWQPEFFELYNLSDDVGQMNDLALKKPVMLNEMKKVFQSNFNEMQKDLVIWKGLPNYSRDEAKHNKQDEFKLNQDIFLSHKQEAIDLRKRGVPGRLGE